MTLLLLIVGALVTSHQAGLSVPDWPTSFGSLYRMPPMVGNVKFEHGHRMLAEFVGILTVLLTAAIQWGGHYKARRTLLGLTVFTGLLASGVFSWNAFAKNSITAGRVDLSYGLIIASLFFLTLALGAFLPFYDERSWMRKLAWVALAAVIAQGVLGGLTVKMFLPWYISTAHAALAQTFFCLLVVMALFTSRDWVEAEPAPAHDVRIPSLYVLALLSLATLYLQLFFGAAFRHNGMPFAPHLINAGVVIILLLWTSLRALKSKIPEIRTPGLWVHNLLMLQIALGFAAYFTRVRWGADAPQPLPSMVASTVAHVGIGALLLAATFVLLFQTRRHLMHSQQTSREQTSVHREAAA